jgi:hypothetical protein
VPCGSYHLFLFAWIYRVLSAGVVFVASGLYLYENDRSIATAADDEVQLAGFATEVARDSLKALCFQELFATPLTPAAKPFGVSEKLSSETWEPEQFAAAYLATVCLL